MGTFLDNIQFSFINFDYSFYNPFICHFVVDNTKKIKIDSLWFKKKKKKEGKLMQVKRLLSRTNNYWLEKKIFRYEKIS